MAKQYETPESTAAASGGDDHVVVVEELQSGVRIERHHGALVYHHPRSSNASPERLGQLLGKWDVGPADVSDPFEERADRLLAQLAGD